LNKEKENRNKVTELIGISRVQAKTITQSLVDPIFVINILVSRIMKNEKLDQKTRKEIQMIKKSSDKILNYISNISKK
jgi:hypothetical protein